MIDSGGVSPRQASEAPPAAVAAAISDRLVAGLGVGRVRAVIGHGSWVHGDFCPGRSDLDLLVVLDQDPRPALLATVQPIVAAVADAHPEWQNRLEVGLVTREAIQGVIDGDTSSRMVGRISPGEPLHLVVADRHRLLDWESARHGRSIQGESPGHVIPTIPAQLVREVVLEHLQNWPSWLTESATAGSQAYAVLTVSRAVAYLATGRQLSKRQSAAWLAARLPAWRPLIDWASAWWYADGTDDDHPPRSVGPFVEAMARDAASGSR